MGHPIVVEFLIHGLWIKLTPAEYRELRKILTRRSGRGMNRNKMKDRGTNETKRSTSQRRA
jgi:hypothetical protein